MKEKNWAAKKSSVRFYGLLIGVSLLLSFNACSSSNSQKAKSPPDAWTNGIVSSAHPLATQAGIEILKKGGNAFDAAVAVAAALNVAEPMMSGMGGYGTILVYHKDSDRIRFLDSSGKIPAAVDADVFRPPTPNYEDNRRGPKAVSTPGNVNAWQAMSKEYGQLKWQNLFTPAVKLAQDGFIISERTARMIESAWPAFPEHAKAFYGHEGQPLQAGDRLVQSDLAESLELIAEQGAAAVYGGPIGQAIDEEMEQTGGFLSLEDLKADRAEWWEPISIDYRGHQVYTASPPATAFPSLIRLGLMRHFDVTELGHNSTDYLHFFAEATKHAYWCRLAYAGDPAINPPPLDRLLSEEYLQTEARRIDRNKALPFSPPGVTSNQGRNTTHFVTADRYGNIVSATQTLGNTFGSRIMPEDTGVWLNNSLYYCTFEPPGNPMDAKPGQRKLSGDCPAIIMQQGRPWAALGTPGGHTIGQTVPQMVMNLIDFNMDIQKALAAPRISFIEPDILAVEDAVPQDIIIQLKAKGHNVRTATALGNAHALTIAYDEDGLILGFKGGADPRGQGKAAGY
jgi:gamma-glutamyltranspeptidase/glutathione hydrolase